MQRQISSVAIIVILSVIVASCAGTPPSLSSKLIDHQNKAYGKPVPDWVILSIGALEAQKEYEGKHIFRAFFSATDLMSARQLARGFDSKEQLIQALGTVVTAKTRAAVNTLSDATAARIIQTMESEAKAYAMPPLKEYDSFWELRQIGNQKPEYNFFILYTVDKQVMDGVVTGVARNAAAKLIDDVSAQIWFEEAF
jgi:ribosome-associated toxin RatA of RatAB toxin-antitoxin module